MNIEHKKTALGDDALIYQRSKDTVSREEIKNLPLKQRLGYFRDYYLKIVLAVAVVVVIVLSILNTAVFNRSESALGICFLNGTLPEQNDALDLFFEDQIGLESKNDYIRSETYATDNYQMDMAYRTKLMAGVLDLVVCPYDDFMEQSEQGMFCDLREFLPEEMYEQLSDLFLENRIEETDDMGEVISYSDPVPIGIDLSGSSLYKEYGGADIRPVLCATWSAPDKRNALTAIALFTGINPPEPESETEG